MSLLERSGHIEIAGRALEFREWLSDPEAPTLVLLHEGLGSAGLWLDFPERLAEATGARVLAYSRAGYGQSDPVPLPRPLSYMHDEAREVLPELLDAIDFERGLLIGHSDGASIAAIYAGTFEDPRLAGISLIAPHFFVEKASIDSIEAARVAYETTNLREKLARWHKNVDVAFRGWNGAWLDPGFRDWDISGFLPEIEVPVQIIQGADDQYGTLEQIEVARARLTAPPAVSILPSAKHNPMREATEDTLRLLADFCDRVLEP